MTSLIVPANSSPIDLALVTTTIQALVTILHLVSSKRSLRYTSSG